MIFKFFIKKRNEHLKLINKLQRFRKHISSIEYNNFLVEINKKARLKFFKKIKFRYHLRYFDNTLRRLDILVRQLDNKND